MRAPLLGLAFALAAAPAIAAPAKKLSTIHLLVSLDEVKAMFRVAVAYYDKDDIAEDGKHYSQTYIDVAQQEKNAGPNGTVFRSPDWGVPLEQQKADIAAMVAEYKKDGRKVEVVPGLDDEAV